MGNIRSFASSEANYFCEALGKRLATKEEWQYANKYSGGPVWVNNGGTIQAWYKCCSANSSVSHYSWTTKTAPLCINTNMTIEKPSTKNQLETTGMLTTNPTPITSN